MFSQTNTINKSLKPTKSHAAQDSIPSFIRKTYDILEEAKFPEVIDWNPEGTAIVIKKPSDFCQKVLPQYFKHNNLTSFVRQLNMYNFHKRRTQNIDHVYAHELFQKGKKHLLKEIRRKNHEAHSNNQSQISQERAPMRLPDTFDINQNPTDMGALSYENQFLKKLYNDAMSRLAAFEAQVNDLTSQNQSLWQQLYQQKNGNAAPKVQQKMIIKREESELTLDKLPMTCGGIAIPPLKLNLEKENTAPTALAMSKIPSLGVNKFFNVGEESTETGESSFTSPSAQNATDADNMPPEYDFQASMLRITPQVSQIQALRSTNDMRISRHEMSIGQLLDAWNVDIQGDNGLLGKREISNGVLDLGFAEPALKRNDLSIFKMKSFFSNKSNGLFNMMNDDFGNDLITFTN